MGLYSMLVSINNGVVIKSTVDNIFHPVHVKGLTHWFVFKRKLVKIKFCRSSILVCLMVILFLLLSLSPIVVFAEEWVSPSSCANWHVSDNACDGDVGSFANCYLLQSGYWSDSLAVYVDVLVSDKVRVYLNTSDESSFNATGLLLEINVHRDMSWVNVANFTVVHPDDDGWTVFEFDGGVVDALYLRFYNDLGGIRFPAVYEVELWDTGGETYGYWELDYMVGDWDICERTLFQSPEGSYEGSAQWSINLNNFTGV